MTDFVDPDQFVDPEHDAMVKKAELAAGIGVGTAAGTWGAGRLLRWALPGITPKRSFLGVLNKALTKDFGEGLKSMYPRYTAAVRDSGKPMTFADWIANQSVRAPETLSVIDKAIDRGGVPNTLAQDLITRGEGQKGRVLSDLAGALGIPETSLNQTTEEYAKTKAANAKGLYDIAFKDKKPLLDQRVYDLFQKHGPVMEGALENAKEAFKYDPSKQVESQTVKALAGHRKDEWKWPLDAENVPPVLHVGEPKNQLQTVITPNIETLDRMKRALWKLQQKRISEKAGDVGRIIEARKDLTSLLGEIAPPEYKAALKQYAGDTALEEAAETGKNLFKQNPDDLRMNLLKMSPDERTALARGFYGSLQNMNDPKFIREVVSGSPAYAKQRDLLSAIFPDTTQLHGFLNSLEGEQAMKAGEKQFVKPGSPEPEKQGIPHIGIAAGHGAHGYLFNALPMPPYDPTNRVMKAGAGMLFDTPQFHPGSMTIPGGEAIPEFNQGHPYRNWNLTAPAVGGGLGAASPYLYDYLKESQ